MTIYNPLLFKDVPPNEITNRQRELLLRDIYVELGKVRDHLDASEKLIAELALELHIERRALEESSSAHNPPRDNIPEYWRLIARGKEQASQEERK